MTETTDKPKHAGGRPTLYKPEYAQIAKDACDQGATDKDLADTFGVNITTIWRWRTTYEGFCKSLKVGKDVADDRVERSLFQKACGYSYDAVKILSTSLGVVKVEYVEHVPPSDTACIYWLKNRRRDEWTFSERAAAPNDLGMDAPVIAPDEVMPGDPIL